MTCPDPECKQSFKMEIKIMKENLYGKGPEGDGGIYGALKKRVTYKAFFWVILVLLGGIGTFSSAILLHESRISKNESAVQTLCTDVSAIKLEQKLLSQAQKTGTKEILEAIEGLKR